MSGLIGKIEKRGGTDVAVVALIIAFTALVLSFCSLYPKGGVSSGDITVAIIAMLGIIVLSLVNLWKNKEKWSEQALGLPTGSVRAIIALLFIVMIIFAALNGIGLSDVPPWLLGIVGTIIGFYFGTKSAVKLASEDKFERIKKLKKLQETGVITAVEFETKKKKFLDEI
jgi:amino acid transporter